MARTIDPAAHALRRDTFVDAAQRLIHTRGYDQTSIQDVYAAVGSSRGAFYHYFDSKSALLEAVVERMVDTVYDSLGPIASDAALSAPEKVVRVFGQITRWKIQRKELLDGLMRVWTSDENALVRDRFRAHAMARLTPLLARILEQGAAEGTTAAAPPRPTAAVFVSLVLAANDHAGRLYVANRAGRVTFEEVRDLLIAYGTAFERVLGLSPGAWPPLDDATLRLWFT